MGAVHHRHRVWFASVTAPRLVLRPLPHRVWHPLAPRLASLGSASGNCLWSAGTSVFGPRVRQSLVRGLRESGVEGSRESGVEGDEKCQKWERMAKLVLHESFSKAIGSTCVLAIST